MIGSRVPDRRGMYDENMKKHEEHERIMCMYDVNLNLLAR
jgi:hypothetical protein